MKKATMYTSDLQLRALGLYPMEHLPIERGVRFIGRTRDGAYIEITIVACPFVDDVRFSAENGEPYCVHDLIGWKHA